MDKRFIIERLLLEIYGLTKAPAPEPIHGCYWVGERRKVAESVAAKLEEISTQTFFDELPDDSSKIKMQISIISDSFEQVKGMNELFDNFVMGEDEKGHMRFSALYHISPKRLHRTLEMRIQDGLGWLYRNLKEEKQKLEELVKVESPNNHDRLYMDSNWLMFFDDDDKAEQCLKELIDLDILIKTSGKKKADREEQIRIFLSYANHDKIKNANGLLIANFLQKYHGIMVTDQTFKPCNLLDALKEMKQNK